MRNLTLNGCIYHVLYLQILRFYLVRQKENNFPSIYKHLRGLCAPFNTKSSLKKHCFSTNTPHEKGVQIKAKSILNKVKRDEKRYKVTFFVVGDLAGPPYTRKDVIKAYYIFSAYTYKT